MTEVRTPAETADLPPPETSSDIIRGKNDSETIELAVKAHRMASHRPARRRSSSTPPTLWGARGPSRRQGLDQLWRKPIRCSAA
jgi:hypothetical protein